MSVLGASAIQQMLKSIPDWKVEGGEIVRTYTFTNFIHSLEFVNLVGKKAEEMGHHPDIDIRYNKVRLALASHDAGGLTEADFALAAASDSVFRPSK